MSQLIEKRVSNLKRGSSLEDVAPFFELDDTICFSDVSKLRSYESSSRLSTISF
jgi:hypothetical protein